MGISVERVEGTVTVPATAESFVVKERLVLGDSPRVVWLGDNFQGWFASKTEESMVETELCYARITGPWVDDPTPAELGENVETTLAQAWQLLKLQPNGQEGVLLNNGWANVFYIRDAGGTLRGVHVIWHGDGWHVDAYSVGDLREWHVEANRAFFRSS